MDAAFDVVVPVCTVEGIDMVVLIGNDGSRLIELVGDGALFQWRVRKPYILRYPCGS